MATSNSTNFSMNGAQIMDHALTLCGIKGLGQAVDSEVINLTRTTFNMLIRSLETSGVRLWGIERGILFPGWGEAKHELPVTSGGVPATYACLQDDFMQTYLSADAAQGASAIVLNEDPGFAAGNYIGIFTSNNGILWYAVNSVAGTTVNLYEVGTTTPASLSEAVTEGTIVVGFTTLAWMPLRIIEARRVQLDVTGQNIEVPMRVVGKFDYERIPNKTMSSIPLQLYHQPLINWTNIWLWPTLGQANILVGYSFERRYQDVDQGVDDVDFPPEAYDALTTLLAARMGRLRRISGDRQQYLDQVSTVYYDQLRSYSSGSATVSFGAQR